MVQLLNKKQVKAMKTTLFFLCTGNSCRSQMAEGWARHLKNDELDVCSAGIEKHGLNPLAVRAMAEVGVDISRHRSKTIDDLLVKDFDYVITLCDHAHESCPLFPAKPGFFIKALTIHPGWQLGQRMKKSSWYITGEYVTKSDILSLDFQVPFRSYKVAPLCGGLRPFASFHHKEPWQTSLPSA